MPDRPITTVDADTAEEFLGALAIHAEPFITDPDADWLFRGHDDDEHYNLVPTVLRRDMLDDCLMMAGRGRHGEHFREIEIFQVWLELQLLRRFLIRADECGLVVPEMSAATWECIGVYSDYVAGMIDATLGDDADGFQRLTQRLLSALDDRDHASWPHPHLYRQLALARHHGLPTRLLDWSRSPRVAAYFAAVAAAKAEEADAPDKKWISVWGISRYARGACSDDNSFRSGIESIQVPNAGNVNLFAQWGQFTTMRVNPRAFDRPIDRRPVDELVQHRAGSLSEAGESAPVPLMYRVRAPRSETMEILWRLSREGIMRHRLFPEFGSVVASLREDWYHWRPNPRGR